VKGLFLLLGLAVGCGGGAKGAESPPQGVNTAEHINKSKCGACHAPRDPGGHTKAELGPNLSDDDWAKLSDYLAKR
jgi:mono/diheme cytochrome c family protein